MIFGGNANLLFLDNYEFNIHDNSVTKLKSVLPEKTNFFYICTQPIYDPKTKTAFNAIYAIGGDTGKLPLKYDISKKMWSVEKIS